MYVIGLYLILAIALGQVMSVLNSILDTLKVGDALRKLPLIGANLTVIVSVLMVWVLEAHVLEGWGWGVDQEWLSHVVNGLIVFGMVPVKDAVVGAISKGLRA